jgi:solute carrier family 13 (sodium-dependent dicarboxylate transporter), member 2/3/5
MLPLAVIVIIAATMIIFLTELTSNIATTATFLPIVGAIVFGSGLPTVPKMARAGLVLNIIGIFLVSLVALTLAPRIL